MRTLNILLVTFMLSVLLTSSAAVMPAGPHDSRERSARRTALEGGIGRGSPLNAGSLITINQGTGAGTVIGHPDSVPGLTGLAFDISGTLYGTTISG